MLFMIDQIRYDKNICISLCFFDNFDIKVKCSFMKYLRVLLLQFLLKFKLCLGSSIRVKRVSSNDFHIFLILHSIFQNKIVLYCCLLLAYSSRIDYIENNILMFFIFNSYFFFSCMKRALSKDFTNERDLGISTLGFSFMIDAILNDFIDTY